MFAVLMLVFGFLILCLSILHSEKIFNSCGDFGIVVFAALVIFGIIITSASAIVLIG